MQKEINQKKSKPLDFKALERFYKKNTNKDLKIIVINEISENSTIETLFDQGCFVLYVPIKDQYSGHFVSMFKNNNKIYYLDSYGNTPKYLLDLSFHPEQNKPFFEIIKNSGLRVIYNTVKYQTLSSKVDDCGRYSVFNCVLYQQYKETNRDYDLKTFHDVIVKYLTQYGYKDYDDAITRLTISI